MEVEVERIRIERRKGKRTKQNEHRAVKESGREEERSEGRDEEGGREG